MNPVAEERAGGAMTEEAFLERFGASLNPAQREAVRSVDGPVLLLAVPGSGKTTVLVTRLGYMVLCRGIAPESILTMTYTVAATREMRSRFTAMFGEEIGSRMEFRTINGLSVRVIDCLSRTAGRSAFRLQEDEGELSRLVREIYRTVNAEYPTDSTVRDIRTAITYIKNQMLTEEEIEKLDIGVKDLPIIYAGYCKALRDARLMDYDDQMQYALTILQKYPAVRDYFRQCYPYICVDESQDTSRIQHEIIRTLASGNLFMVGDEDQSIYGFRAAYPDALMHFETDYPGAKVLTMEENYRSTAEIIEAANGFVEKNKFRRPKIIRCTGGSGDPLQIISVRDRDAQFRWLVEEARRCTGQTAVLFRNNDSAVPLIDRLEREGIPYNCRAFDEVFFAHRVVRDVEDIIRFAFDPADMERFLRIYYKLDCKITKTQAEYACKRSARTGNPVLRELIYAPETKQNLRSKLEDLQHAFTLLEQGSASDAIRRIRTDLGYKAYLEHNRLDEGKIAILDMLAEHIPTPMGLLDRLEELRSLIRDHRNSGENNLILSTIHSAKGLEFDRVFLLDVFDGILPAAPHEDVRSEEEIRHYQEERRLYYVAMTRAKRELNLFRSDTEPSEFTDEILRRLGAERFETTDALDFLSRKWVGLGYRHRTLGSGTIIAQRDADMLVQFLDGTVCRFSLEQMAAQRHRTYGPPERKPGKKTAQKAAAGEGRKEIAAGSRVIHSVFGPGTVEKVNIETIKIRFDEGKTRTFLKSAVLPTGKVKLYKG